MAIFNPLALNVFWSAFVAGFASSIIITGNLKTAIKSGIIAGALAFAGNAAFGKGTGVDAGDASAAVKGGVKDVISSNSFEASNSIANNVPSATGQGLEMVAEQSGNGASNAIGSAIEEGVVNLDNINALHTGHFNSQPLLEGLIAGTISALSALKLAHNINKEDNLTNAKQISEQIRNTVFRFQGVSEAFGQARDLLAFSVAIADVGFGITSKVGVGLASGSKIALQGGQSLARGGAFAAKEASMFIRSFGIGARLEIATATIDGIGVATGTVTREAIKQGFAISIRREATQQVIQQSIKEAAINNIIKTTTKILVK